MNLKENVHGVTRGLCEYDHNFTHYKFTVTRELFAHAMAYIHAQTAADYVPYGQASGDYDETWGWYIDNGFALDVMNEGADYTLGIRIENIPDGEDVFDGTIEYRTASNQQWLECKAALDKIAGFTPVQMKVAA